MTIAQKMAQFTYALDLSDIPADVERAARRHLADTLACGIGAYGQPPVRALVRYARARGGQGSAALTGYGDRTSPAMAALVNGTMVRYLDANDISAFGGGHFSDGIPPLLAVAQDRGLSADELVTATVALYEIQGALARAFDFMSRRYHALTQIPWTTPIVASRLLGADSAAAVNAVGLSGSMGMALNTWLKPTGNAIPSIKGVAVGLAGQRAVESAEIAAQDVTAPPDALEFAFETLGMMGGPPPNPSAFDRLGSDWAMTRQVIKSYPSQIYTQAAAQAALDLRRRVGSAEEIESVTLYGHRNVCAAVQGSPAAFRPASRESADHSTPFVMAQALLDGRVTLREFENDAWLSPQVTAMMDRITLVVDPELDRAFTERGVFGVRLKAALSGGRAEIVQIHQPKGHPDDPMTNEELIAKISWLTEAVAPETLPASLFDHCMSMSTQADLNKLTELCALRK